MNKAVIRYLPIVALVGGIACGGEEPSTTERAPVAAQQQELGCPASHSVSGVVEETAHVSRYTYLKLRSGDETVWAAVRRSDVEIGEEVRIVHAIQVENFRSPSTGKVFPRLYMGYLTAPDVRTCPAKKTTHSA